MIKKNYTIKDIAKLAGVSKGTVDRVLHKRGRVSEKTFEKVKAVLDKIDYHPNLIARNLKNNRVYHIGVLLPDPAIDPFWAPAHEGILVAAKEFMPFGVLVGEYYYHPDDRASFLAQAGEVLKSEPDALLMAPLFRSESLTVLRKCRDTGIVIASFNNTVDRLHNENFIGQDLFQSGRVAASLIDKMVSPAAAIGIIHINEEPHMRQKEQGFKNFFKNRNNHDIRIFSYNLSTEGLSDFKEQIVQFIGEHQAMAALFVTNSKAYLLMDALQGTDKGLVVVGYDLLDENIRYIRDGRIDFLIHQQPHRQAYLGVGQLAEHFLFGKNIPAQKLLPIDVVTSENFQYYLN